MSSEAQQVRRRIKTGDGSAEGAEGQAVPESFFGPVTQRRTKRYGRRIGDLYVFRALSASCDRLEIRMF